MPSSECPDNVTPLRYLLVPPAVHPAVPVFDNGMFGADGTAISPARTFEHGKKGKASWHGFQPG